MNQENNMKRKIIKHRQVIRHEKKLQKTAESH